ncbi:hypothetical protein [Ralstonia pseudosolanacearum]|nr:hypothetical protein [Ralstonia pseudosolanacearum]
MKKNVAAVGVAQIVGAVTTGCQCAYAQSQEIYSGLGTEGGIG